MSAGVMLVFSAPASDGCARRDRLAIYTVEDVAAAQSGIAAAASGLTMSDTLQRNPPVLVIFYDEPA